MARSKKYWENRMIQLYNSQDKANAKVEKKMVKEYQRTGKAIDKEVASYYAQYGKDDVIQYRKLVISLNKSERDLLYKNVNAFVTKYPQHADLMPVRKSIYQLNRLEGLQLSVRQHMLELGAVEQEEFDKVLRGAYERGYLSTMEGLDNKETLFKVDDEVMRETLNRRWTDRANYSDRLWANKNRLVNTLNTQLRDGLIRGDSYKQIAEMIEKRAGVGAFESKRLVQTESAFILNQANQQAFIDEGIERYEITAVMDSKTSKTCRELDTEKFKFSQAKVGTNYPPFHPFCRTTVIPIENN